MKRKKKNEVGNEIGARFLLKENKKISRGGSCTLAHVYRNHRITNEALYYYATTFYKSILVCTHCTNDKIIIDLKFA